MTLKKLDDLILQVFESSEKFFFPIVSQIQAKAFVKVLHENGLEYNVISEEINETLERFSTWRKNLSCSKVGQRIIQRINQPFYQILEEGEEGDSCFETLFHGELDMLSSEKIHVNRNSRLWKLLNENKIANSDVRKDEHLSRNSSDNLSKHFTSNDSPTRETESDTNSKAKNSENLNNLCNSKDLTNGESHQHLPHRVIPESERRDVRAVEAEGERSRSPSDASSTEEQFVDCDSFKSCSSTFVDDSIAGHSVFYSFLQESGPSFDGDHLLSPKEQNASSPSAGELYDADLDIFDYEEDSPNILKLRGLLDKLKRERPKGGYFYAFVEKGSGFGQALVKIGVSRNPEKKLLRALTFNTRLSMLKTAKVADAEKVLEEMRLRFRGWRVDGHPDWYLADEGFLRALQAVESE